MRAYFVCHYWLHPACLAILFPRLYLISVALHYMNALKPQVYLVYFARTCSWLPDRTYFWSSHCLWRWRVITGTLHPRNDRGSLHQQNYGVNEGNDFNYESWAYTNWHSNQFLLPNSHFRLAIAAATFVLSSSTHFQATTNHQLPN